MRIGSVCSGIEGFGLGLEWAGVGHIVWTCENDPSASLVLAERYPSVPNLGDLKTVDWEAVKRMPAPRKDDVAEAMYDRYCQGLSLADVALEFGRSRQTVWKMFERRGWDMRERPPAKPAVEFNGRRFTLRTNGYYAATEGDRAFLHRAVWEHHVGALPPDWDVHHINHDKTDNRIENLQAMPKDAHTRLHAGEVVPSDSPIDLLIAGYPLDPASPSPTPAGVLVPTTPATSGPMSSTPFAFYDPDSHSLRMSQGTFLSDSTECSLTLPASGSMRAGELYAHPTWVLPISEHGCSSSPLIASPRGGRTVPDSHGRTPAFLLPTPASSDQFGPGEHGEGGNDLRTTLSLLPTPRTSDAKGSNSPGELRRHTPGLGAIGAVLLPTPTSQAAKHALSDRGAGTLDDCNLWSVVLRFRGEPTNPQSDDGKDSPDPLPLQWMSEEG